MAKKIFVGNYKGGVGKTTSVYQIGGWMAQEGKRVLLVDLDPQASLSRICTRNDVKGLEKLNYNETLNYAIELYSAYVETKLDRLKLLKKDFENMREYVKDIIKEVKVFKIKESAKFDYIPSTINFKNSRLNDLARKMTANLYNIFSIRFILNDLDCDENYDYIIFDCPPTSNMITHSVFLLSDYYIIPTICDDISADGVPDYIIEIESIYAKYSFNDEVGGLLLDIIVGNKPKLVGVFETIYKNRPGTKNWSKIEQIDKAISQTGVPALISKERNAKYRYSSGDPESINTTYIFKEKIRHLDNRSNDCGIPAKTESGSLHDEYRNISKAIMDILEDDEVNYDKK
ncbi:MAG: chromosome partitioning protein [Epulopiscium sp.]|jgi:cellulose biosynthesis protein BcsQ|uniref:AAA family ATPase n=1 Tax=Defluviitalea raffinosedens TaxID=1450156 RepID=A0A7C8HGM6_9FIRM|nr:AAA family ATPase [Defluviitalea raffinosedens]KAE9634115.1 AAA family ATPase [Defluviitalea raffinosedens]MBM7686826.1 cellulose biosynthesis protein BcsQ [Defluviitalea raffinosedens]MDK2789301.1 chromosome partitioning protein [Candidatus Epulonipiscium sp.]HHW68063.1 AAA family ATPase [Candidatus Epulonipiscium sp.]